jgi:hypothetical protein
MNFEIITWYYCLLCGERNCFLAFHCRRCGIGKYALFGKELPPTGWAVAMICYDLVRPIDETHESNRFMVEVRTSSGKSFINHTNTFVCKKWEDWYPEAPPIPTPLENEIKNALVDQLHNDGWLDALAGNGEPTNNIFWRRISKK